MKTKTLRLLTVLIAALGVVSAQAQLDKRVVITPVKNADAVNVYVDLKEDVPYTVALEDAKGKVLWHTNWNKPVFAKSVLLDEIPDGSYTVMVKSPSQYFRNDFTLQKGETYISNEQARIASPTVSVMKDFVLVDFDSGANGDDVDVTIYDETGLEVFANTITSDARRITRYDMSTLPSGRYDMIFTIDGMTFTKSVRIQ